MKKIILDEPKLHLSEPRGLQLTERYILNEDEPTNPQTTVAQAAPAAEPTINIAGLLDEIKDIVCGGGQGNKGLTAEIKAACHNTSKLDALTKKGGHGSFGQIIDAQKLADDAVKANDFTKVPGDVNNYIGKLKTVLDSNTSYSTAPNVQDLKNLITELEKLCATASNTTALQKTIALIVSKYNTLKTSLATVYRSDNFEFTTDIDARMTEATEQIKHFKLEPDYAKALSPKTASGFRTRLLEQKDKLNALNVKSITNTKAFENYIDILTNIISIYQELTINIQDGHSARTANLDRTKASKADWDKLYKAISSAEEDDLFWHGDPNGLTKATQLGYYQSEWGAKAELVESFGLAFVQELKTYGWDSINNPFISFLKQNLDKLSNLNKTTYPILHNLVATRVISVNDLRGKGHLGQVNLVFNNNWYASNVADIKEFAHEQHRLINERHNLTGKASTLAVTDNGLQTIFKNVFYQLGDSTNFSKTLADNSQLKPLTRVKQNITQLLGEGKTDIKDAEIQAILDNINADTAKKMVVHLVDALRLNQSDIINKVDNLTNGGLLDLYDTIQLKYKEHQQLDAQLHLTDRDFKYNQLEALLLALAEKAGVYTPKTGV